MSNRGFDLPLNIAAAGVAFAATIFVAASVRMPVMILASALIALQAQSANAQERTLNGMNGAGTVIVWKNLEALQEGTDLISAGVAKRNPGLAYRLIACIVPNGTSAIVTDSTIGTRNILVTSGDFSGCRGSVNVEVLRD